MRPLAAMPAALRARIRGVLTDIDDTLSTSGRIEASTYAALERLHRAGLIVVPVTGRPAGWCDHIARMWPVDGVVGENGAFYMRHEAQGRPLLRRFVADDEARESQRFRLAELAQAILGEVPGSALASDQPYRESDLAIDYREDVPALPPDAVGRIVALMEAGGLTVRVSSIHVNGWFGGFDKLSTALLFLRETWGLHEDIVREDFAFIGDSPNDAAMFRFFPASVAVANIAPFLDRLEVLPRYVTKAPAGQGFIELAESLLAARADPKAAPAGGV